MGSKSSSCGSIFDKIFEPGNVFILIMAALTILVVAASTYAKEQAGLNKEYSLGQETVVTSTEEVKGEDGSVQYLVTTRTVDKSETIEDMKGYEAASSENRNKYILFCVGGLMFLFVMWFVMCRIC